MYIILQYFYSLSVSLFVFSVHIFTCAKGTSHFSRSLFYSGCVSKPYEGNLGVSQCPVGVQIHMVENLISGAL